MGTQGHCSNLNIIAEVSSRLWLQMDTQGYLSVCVCGGGGGGGGGSGGDTVPRCNTPNLQPPSLYVLPR